MNTIISYQARQAIAIGRKNHWRFSVTEKRDEWVYETVEVPQVGLDRIDALRRAGVRINGFVVGHEAPRILTAPKEEKKHDFKITPVSIPDLSFLFEFAFLIVGAVFRAVLLDPALIVVLEDGTWLEVMNWR